MTFVTDSKLTFSTVMILKIQERQQNEFIENGQRVKDKFHDFINRYTLKNSGLFFFIQMLGSAHWVILLGYFLIFLPRCWVIFFNPKAGFSLLGHFIGLF